MTSETDSYESAIVLITDNNKHVAINEQTKRMLSLKTEYFRQLFYGWSVDSTKQCIRMKDTDCDALRFIIEFLVSDSFEFRCLDHIGVTNILVLAHRLNITALICKCVHVLCSLLYRDNVFDIYSTAKFYELKCCGIDVENYCLRFMANFANIVFDRDLFANLSFDEFSAIIQCIPHSRYETIIRNAVMRYIQINDINENSMENAKLLSTLLSKRSKNNSLNDNKLISTYEIITIEKPISLIDFVLSLGDEHTIVDNITFYCDRIGFGSIAHLFYLDIRKLEVSYDSNHCKVKLYIRIKSAVIAHNKYSAMKFFTSNCVNILFADPVKDVRYIIGQLFRVIDCKFIA